MLLTTDKLFLEDEGSARRSLPDRGRACPRCDSHSIAHSRIRGMFGQVVRRVLHVRPYRCLDCWHRFLGISTR